MDILKDVQKARAEQQKKFAVLIDPEMEGTPHLKKVAEICSRSYVDYLFIGGSLLLESALDASIEILRKESNIPIVLFPGNNLQISSKADALLLLSLISGRNPEFLIGQHVVAAPRIARTRLEVIPTAYILIDGGRTSSVQYMSNTLPIPSDKVEIAICTALAGQQLGMKVIYMDAGSGARQPIPGEMVSGIKNNVDLPIICGGGIRTAQEAFDLSKAGADLIVVGNAIEKDPKLIMEMSVALKESIRT